MNKAVDSKVFNPVQVGSNKVKVLFSQFADATIFVGEASKSNTLNPQEY